MLETKISSAAVRGIVSDSKFKLFHFYVIFLCFLIITGEGYNLFLYGSVLPLLTQEWSISPVQAGLIGSYGLIGMMFGSIIFGYIADKIGRKKVIMLSVVLYSLFTALCGFAGGPVLFSCFRFIAGLGIGGALPNVVALATDYSPKALRNTLVALMLCGMQVGGILGPVVSINTMDSFSWHAVLWMGGIPLVLLPFLYKYLPESISFLLTKGKLEQVKHILAKIEPSYANIQEIVVEEARNEEKGQIKSLFQEGRALDTCLFWIAFFMTLLIIYGLGTWLPELMVQAGNSLSSSLVFPIVLNVGGIIGTFVFARIADKWLRPKTMLVILYFLGALSLILLGFKYSMPVLCLVISVTGACIYGLQNLINPFVSQFYPAHIRSTGLGLCMGIGRLGGIFGSAFWGALLQSNLSVQANFFIFAIPSVIAALAVWLVRVKRQ